MAVHFQDESIAAFGGSYEPAYTANIYSVGQISPELNHNTSAKLGEFLEQELGLPSKRGGIKFFDIKSSDWGWKGTIVSSLSLETMYVSKVKNQLIN
jgi:Macrophage migration inhibitory factor (MIF)